MQKVLWLEIFSVSASWQWLPQPNDGDAPLEGSSTNASRITLLADPVAVYQAEQAPLVYELLGKTTSYKLPLSRRNLVIASTRNSNHS